MRTESVPSTTDIGIGMGAAAIVTLDEGYPMMTSVVEYHQVGPEELLPRYVIGLQA